MPNVLPSRENEWQFAQVCMPVRRTRLAGWETSRRRHAMSWTLLRASGWMIPFSAADGMSGTSR